MRFYTSRLVITSLTSAEVGDVHALHCLPETDKFNTLGIPDNLKTTERILQGWLAEPTTLVFTIRLKNTESFLGLIALQLKPAKFKSAEVWYKLHVKYWGYGYATEVLHSLLDFGFADLKLHRIEAGCAVANIASIRVLEKVGMIREGSRRKALPIRGNWVDTYQYAVLADEYAPSASL